MKEGPGFLEEQLHGARGEAGDWSHGSGWDSTDAEVVNSTTGADFPRGVFLGQAVEEGEAGWRRGVFFLSWIFSEEPEEKHLEGRRFRYPSFDYVHSSS